MWADFKWDQSLHVCRLGMDRKERFLFTPSTTSGNWYQWHTCPPHVMITSKYSVIGKMTHGSQKSWTRNTAPLQFEKSYIFIISYNPITFLPTERRCHVTAGVAKQANTSSVLLKWVMWGLATAWPRHWPHIRTCPLWALAADVWLVWHAATSTILVAKTELKKLKQY